MKKENIPKACTGLKEDNIKPKYKSLILEIAPKINSETRTHKRGITSTRRKNCKEKEELP